MAGILSRISDGWAPHYPTHRMISATFFWSRSAYTASVIAALAWPSASCAASSPNARRISVAAVCRSWYGWNLCAARQALSSAPG